MFAKPNYSFEIIKNYDDENYFMKINNYSFGKIVIDGKLYTSDLIIFPNRVHSNWWREEGHLLSLGDIEEVLEYNPEYLVIGTGAYGMMKVSDKVRVEAEGRNIKVFILPTAEACNKFNELISTGKKIVAALHLTC